MSVKKEVVKKTVKSEVEENVVEFPARMLERLKQIASAEVQMENKHKEDIRMLQSIRADMINVFIETKGIEGNPRLTDDLKLKY